MKLHEKLAALRKKRGLSQQAAAEKLDISRQAISKWEQGTALPTTENLIQLSRLYGVTVEGLCDEELPLDHPAAQTVHSDRKMEVIFIPKKWIVWVSVLLAVAALVGGNFACAHRAVLFANQEQAVLDVAAALEETYGIASFEPLEVERRLSLLSPAADRLEWIWTDGTTEFQVYSSPNGSVTDSYGVQIVEQKLLQTIRTCAQKAGIEQYLDQIQWRQEGLYHSDSDLSAFYRIDPDTPLSQLDRIHFVKLRDIPDRETGVMAVKHLLAQLEQEGITLAGVSFSFRVEQVYHHITTDTQSAKNLTAEQVMDYTPN